MSQEYTQLACGHIRNKNFINGEYNKQIIHFLAPPKYLFKKKPPNK